MTEHTCPGCNDIVRQTDASCSCHWEKSRSSSICQGQYGKQADENQGNSPDSLEVIQSDSLEGKQIIDPTVIQVFLRLQLSGGNPDSQYPFFETVERATPYYQEAHPFRQAERTGEVLEFQDSRLFPTSASAFVPKGDTHVSWLPADDDV